jgi:orotidine-5'-phosphate decarboxylase
MTLPMTVDFKTSKWGIDLLTSSVFAGKGCMREHLQAANIFTHLGFGILLLYKT